MTNVSAVVLAYNRPHNIDILVDKLNKLKQIDEIFILYGHKDYKNNNIVDDKVIHVDNWEENDNIYLMRRFNINNYSSVKNNCILMLDDDLCPSQKLLDDMIQSYNKNNKCLYGPQSRYCGHIYEDVDHLRYIYTILLIVSLITLTINICFLTYFPNIYTGVFFGISLISLIITVFLLLRVPNYNVIIPGLSITDKEVIQYTCTEMNKEEHKHIFDEVVKNKGNGEDLFFNFAYRKLYNKPVCIKGKYDDLDVSNGFSTTNSNDHMRFRTNFCKNFINPGL